MSDSSRTDEEGHKNRSNNRRDETLSSQFNTSSAAQPVPMDIPVLEGEEGVYDKEAYALIGEAAHAKGMKKPLNIQGQLNILITKIEATKKQRKFKDLLHFIFILTIQKELLRVNEILDFHREQMKQLLEEIEEGNKALQELQDGYEALAKVASDYEDTGGFDINENGTLRNVLAEKALQDYEHRKGIAIDRNGSNLYLQLLEAQADIELRQDSMQLKIIQHGKAYEQHKTRYDEALKIKDDLESGNVARQKNGLAQLNSLGAYNKIALLRNIFENSNTPQAQQELLRAADLIAEDLEAADFTFDFSPLEDNSIEQTDEDNDRETNAPVKPISSPKL